MSGLWWCWWLEECFFKDPAGGGALELKADGDLTIASGVLISANGGDGRTNGNTNYSSGSGAGLLNCLVKIFTIMDCYRF